MHATIHHIRIHVMLAAATALTLVACQREAAAPKVTTPSESATDPLATFKVIASRCLEEVADSDKTEPGKQGGFYRLRIKIGEKSFDVRRTDSLVSPYIATIDISYSETAGTAPNKEALTDVNNLPLQMQAKWRLQYSFQNNGWKLMQEEQAAGVSSAGIEVGALQPQPVGSLAKRIPSAISCVV